MLNKYCTNYSKVYNGYKKPYINEILQINDILASGYYVGKHRETLINRKTKLHNKINTFRKYLVKLLKSENKKATCLTLIMRVENETNS
jgi:hypothetical protein